MQNQPPILTIKMVPAGVEVVLKGLSKLSIEEAGALFQEIRGQAEHQMQELQKTQPVDAPAEAPAEAADELVIGGTD